MLQEQKDIIEELLLKESSKVRKLRQQKVNLLESQKKKEQQIEQLSKEIEIYKTEAIETQISLKDVLKELMEAKGELEAKNAEKRHQEQKYSELLAEHNIALSSLADQKESLLAKDRTIRSLEQDLVDHGRKVQEMVVNSQAREEQLLDELQKIKDAKCEIEEQCQLKFQEIVANSEAREEQLLIKVKQIEDARDEIEEISELKFEEILADSQTREEQLLKKIKQVEDAKYDIEVISELKFEEILADAQTHELQLLKKLKQVEDANSEIEEKSELKIQEIIADSQEREQYLLKKLKQIEDTRREIEERSELKFDELMANSQARELELLKELKQIEVAKCDIESELLESKSHQHICDQQIKSLFDKIRDHGSILGSINKETATLQENSSLNP